MTRDVSAAPAAPVHLVGTGPGDPDLLTLRAVAAIEASDVVVVGPGVSGGIRALIPAAAEILDAVDGRIGTVPVGRAVVERVAAGRTVAVLRGGDAYAFGGFAEEAAHLATAGIRFQAVPAINLPAGCGARGGIPLTHRGEATGVRFVCLDDDTPPDWAGLADPDTTLALYGTLEPLAEIAARLIGAGLPAETPAAAYAGTTCSDMRSLRTTLADVPGRVAAAGMGRPALLLVGRVVGLAERLAPWTRAGENGLKAHG